MSHDETYVKFGRVIGGTILAIFLVLFGMSIGMKKVNTDPWIKPQIKVSSVVKTVPVKKDIDTKVMLLMDQKVDLLEKRVVALETESSATHQVIEVLIKCMSGLGQEILKIQDRMARWGC